MLFNSLPFLVFFVVVTTAYFTLPHRYRWFWLLAASCYFYMAFIPVYILVLAFTIAVDYAAALGMERSEGQPHRRRLYFLLGMFLSLGVLFFFNSFTFFNTNIPALPHSAHPSPLP